MPGLTPEQIKLRYDAGRLRALAVEEGLTSRRNRIQCPRRCSDAADSCTLHTRDGVGIFKCQRQCGAAGSVIDLVVDLRGCSVAEALEYLGSREAPQPIKEVKRRAINGGAVWQNLVSADEAATRYLEARGLGEAVERELVRFNVGASGDFYCDNLSHLYRLAVPLRDREGRVVSFQLRAIAAPPNPKDNKRNLPGPMPESCFGDPKSARTSPVVYLTEGLADTLAVQLAGVTVVGAPGVSLLAKLVGFLGNVNGRIFVACPQNDEKRQSQSAFAELLATIAEAGGAIRVLPTPETWKDPAEWLQARGLELFAKFVAAAPSFQPPAPLEPRTEAPEGPKRFALTDLGNAERLVHRHGQDLRHCHTTASWFHWSGARWEVDSTGEVVRRATETVRAIVEEESRYSSDVYKHALKSESASAIAAMVKLGASRRGVPVEESDFDKAPLLLNCPNGTLDLATGQLRPHRREELQARTVSVPFDAAAKAPRWRAFLESVFQGSDELINYLQRFFGYCLTGLTREHVFHIFHGHGRNGKGTLCDTIGAVLGGDGQESYFGTAPIETFIESRYGSTAAGPREDLVGLMGRRLVCASEMPENARLETSLIKRLTGEDRITASRKHQHSVTFKPVAKYILQSNPRPKIRYLDAGIQARLRFVPFERQFLDGRANRHLRDELLAEAPGILAWLVEGAGFYLSDGLDPPSGLTEATAAYLLEQDLVGQFLQASRFVVRTNVPEDRVASGWLFETFEKWCKEEGKLRDDGRPPVSQTWFGSELTRRGHVEVRPDGRRWRSGLREPDAAPSLV